jgi:hypothetical protein
MMAVVTNNLVRAGSPELWPIASPLAEADYADVFTAATAKAMSHSPEQWARYILEGASVPMRIFLRVGWRFGLGFALARRNAVLGWPVMAGSPDWVVLQQRSWLFEVALLMRVTDGQLSWATRVRYSSPIAGAAWLLIGVLHRRFAPRALRRAVANAAA